MNHSELKYQLSASPESAIVIEVLEHRLWLNRKYFLAFDKFTASLNFVPENPPSLHLTLEIEAASLHCRDRRLKNIRQRGVNRHLRNLLSNSIIRFDSEQAAAKPLRGLTVEGKLTIDAATQPFRLNVSFTRNHENQWELEGDSLFRFSELGIKPPRSFLGLFRIDDQALVQMHLAPA